MKELFQRIRMAAYLSSVLTVLSGILLIVWPMEVTGLICQILGIMLVIMGAVYLFGYFVEGRGVLTVTGGLLFLLFGVWVFVRPESVVRLVPIVIGVILLVHSLKDFQMASEVKRNGSDRWGLLFLLALLNTAFGVVCICDSFGVVSLALRMLGAALLYDGISDVIIVHHAVQAVKHAAEKLEPIDVESHEIE